MEKKTLNRILAIPFGIAGLVFFFLSLIALNDYLGPPKFSYEIIRILILVVPLIISLLIWTGKWQGFLGGLAICALVIYNFNPFSGFIGIIFPTIFILPFVVIIPFLLYSLFWQKNDKGLKILKKTILASVVLGLIFLAFVYISSAKVAAMEAAKTAEEARAEKAKQEIAVAEENKRMQERLDKFAPIYPSYLPDGLVKSSERLDYNDTQIIIQYYYKHKLSNSLVLKERKGYSKPPAMPEVHPDAINVSTFVVHGAPAVYFESLSYLEGKMLPTHGQWMHWYSGDFYIEAHAFFSSDVLPREELVKIAKSMVK